MSNMMITPEELENSYHGKRRVYLDEKIQQYTARLCILLSEDYGPDKPQCQRPFGLQLDYDHARIDDKSMMLVLREDNGLFLMVKAALQEKNWDLSWGNPKTLLIQESYRIVATGVYRGG